MVFFILKGVLRVFNLYQLVLIYSQAPESTNVVISA